jgi:hypothetical protein
MRSDLEAEPFLQECDIRAAIAECASYNKLARMAWAMMARNERYKEPAALAA